MQGLSPATTQTFSATDKATTNSTPRKDLNRKTYCAIVTSQHLLSDCAKMPPRVWLKVVCTLLLGFWLGLLLGFISSTLLFALMPQQWLENGFKDRQTRHHDFLSRRACKKAGFQENFDPATNTVQICACWPDGGMNSGAGAGGGLMTCKGFERMGYSELGVL